MKNILLIFLTVVLTVNVVIAQIKIFTPNGNQITNISDDGFTTYELQSIRDEFPGVYTDVEPISDGDDDQGYYNCHGYAWHMTGTNSGIYPTSNLGHIFSGIEMYWEDKSYVETQSPSYGDKVVYVGDDHSAVFYDIVSGREWHVSKWGPGGPLVKHPIDQSPYTASGFAYYKKNPAYISPAGNPIRMEGERKIDYNPYPNENINDLSFQLYGSNAGNITWDVSGIQRVSSSGNTVTVRRTDSGSGTATLTALSGGNVITKRVFQLSAAPPPPVISGSKTVCSSATFSVNINSWQSGYHWSTNSSLINISDTLSNSTTISRANSSSKGESWVSVKNDRGTTVAIYYFWVGLPTLSGSFPSSSGWVGEPTDWTVMPYHPDYNTTTIEAYKGSIYAYAISTGGGHFNIYFPEAGNYTIMAYATNNCGSSPPLYYYNFTVYNYSMSLNSRSNELEIVIDDGESGRSLATSNFTVTISDSNKASRSQSSYSGSNFKVPVSSLPDGTYTVSISNGKLSKTTELVIKR